MKPLESLSTHDLTEFGVVDWGYTQESIPHSFSRYDSWTQDSLHGPLGYLNDHRKNLRQDLKTVFPEFQSALVFLFSYQGAKKWLSENNHFEVASYALGFGGEDYHFALKKRLELISDQLKKTHPDLKTFVSLDIQPVLERDLAFRAGLGWFGKNSMIINRKEGSYFIIGSLLLNKSLGLETPILETDHCGQCVACIEACPTLAIDPETRTLIADKCISTFTIELFKDAPAPEGMEKGRGEVFGCDICQDVCPWNKKPLQRVQSLLLFDDRFTFLKDWLFEWPKEKLQLLIQGETNRGFKKKLQGTAFERPGKEGWLKNLKALLTSTQNGLSKKNKGED